MKRFLLPAILLLAVTLRVIWLDRFPTGFTPDEASFGYDAYSILKTGKDQWGHPFPLVLESFGDFKSPLYAYLTVPSVAIFGLNKFAVRLPNAILGTLAVAAAYLLTTKLFNKRVGLFSCFLLAISPWHIPLSRGAFEASLTTFFLPFGLWLFLEKRYALSGLILGLNLLTYHSARFVTPIVIFMLVLVYRKELGFTTSLRSGVVKMRIPALVFLSFFALSTYSLTIGAWKRVGERSITQGATEAAFSERIRSSSIFHNKYTVITKRFLTNYVTYLSPQFFFTQGANEGTYGMIPGRGVLFWFTVPFLLMGIRKRPYFLLAWIFLSPIPAALATGVGFSANRVAVMMPAIEILLGVGAFEFFDWLRGRKILLITYYLIIIGSLALFAEDYFVQSPYKIAKDTLYGNLEAAYWLTENKGEKAAIVSKTLSEPHIYIAFANQWDPKDYQKQTKSWKYKEDGVFWVDQIPSYSLDNYVFQTVDWKKNSGKPYSFLVGKPDEFREGVVAEKVISYPDGSPAILIVDSDKQLYARND